MPAIVALGLLSQSDLGPVQATANAQDAAGDFFVAPDGNDAWSGRLPKPNAEGTDGPFASVPAAQAAVRKARAAQPTKPVTVRLRGGVHRLRAPLVFTPPDSGAPGATVTYAAYPGETPVLSGGVAITGWQQRSGGVWRAPVPEARDGKWLFRRLYVNGQRRALARTPDSGKYFRIDNRPLLHNDPETGEEVDATKFAFLFKGDDLRAWPRLRQINAVVLRNWESAILPIESVDEKTHMVVFTGPMKWELRRGLRYYVEGFREALDAPGEWWLDRQEGALYYRPLPGEDMNTVSVVAPKLTEFVVMRGGPGIGLHVEHITFDGLAFRHSDYTVPPTGHSDWQAAVTIPAAIGADGARNITFRRCEVRNVGRYAIWFRRGCTNNRVEQCEIADLGAGGVRIGEAGRAVGVAATGGNVVHNCFIHDGGSVYYGAIPVWIGQSSDNQVTHNEICDFNYTGVSVGWCWGFAPTSCHRNTIAYNHLHHLGRGVLFDMAAIYTLGISTGTVIHHNLIHHIWGWVEPTGAGGIYPDEGSSGLLIENNVVYCTQSGSLTVHYGRDNVVRNNIFAFGQQHQIHLGRAGKHSSQTLLNNIVYFSEGGLFLRLSELVSDRNVYWHTGGDDVEFPGALSFEQWQQKGCDVNSVMADPKFVDPENFDFRLQPDSPALKLGFKPIDVSTAGLVGDPEWVARPKALPPGITIIPPREEPPPLVIRDDLEQTPLRGVPRFANVHGETRGASVRVTDECAASGSRSLKFVDVPGLRYVWNPHISCHPRLRQGLLHGSFDIRLLSGARFYTEWRSGRGIFVAGPSVRMEAGGEIAVNGKPVCAAPVETWIHVDLLCDLRKRGGRTARATISVPNAPPQTLEVDLNPRFKALDWAVFVADSTRDGVFYLDNIVLEQLEE